MANSAFYNCGRKTEGPVADFVHHGVEKPFNIPVGRAGEPSLLIVRPIATLRSKTYTDPTVGQDDKIVFQYYCPHDSNSVIALVTVVWRVERSLDRFPTVRQQKKAWNLPSLFIPQFAVGFIN